MQGKNAPRRIFFCVDHRLFVLRECQSCEPFCAASRFSPCLRASVEIPLSFLLRIARLALLALCSIPSRRYLMRIRVWVVAALLFPPFIAHAQSRFTVGSASAAPGEKSAGTLEVPAGVDPATSIPVVVVNGAKPGKVIALVSGAHATEYVSIIATEKLIAALDPAHITGTILLVPLINIQSFDQKVPHVNPVDNKRMNPFYPHTTTGTQ